MDSFQRRVLDAVAGELQDIRRLFLDSPNKPVDLQPILDQMGSCCQVISEMSNDVLEIRRRLAELSTDGIPTEGHKPSDLLYDPEYSTDPDEDVIHKLFPDADELDALTDGEIWKRIWNFVSHGGHDFVQTSADAFKTAARIYRMVRDFNNIRKVNDLLKRVKALSGALGRLEGEVLRESKKIQEQVKTLGEDLMQQVEPLLSEVTTKLIKEITDWSTAVLGAISQTKSDLDDHISTSFTVLHDNLQRWFDDMSEGLDAEFMNVKDMLQALNESLALCCARTQQKLDKLLLNTSALGTQQNVNANFENRLKAIQSEVSQIRGLLQQANSNPIGTGQGGFIAPDFYNS